MTSDKSLQLQKIRTTVKRTAVEQLHVQPRKILQQIVDGTEGITFSAVEPLSLAGYRARKKNFPKLPKGIEEALGQIEAQSMLQDSQGMKIYVEKQEQIIAITFQENIKF